MSIDAYLVQAETQRTVVSAADLANAAAVAEHRRAGRPSLRTLARAPWRAVRNADDGAPSAPLGVLAADA